jgi:hypothetical protein
VNGLKAPEIAGGWSGGGRLGDGFATSVMRWCVVLTVWFYGGGRDGKGCLCVLEVCV